MTKTLEKKIKEQRALVFTQIVTALPENTFVKLSKQDSDYFERIPEDVRDRFVKHDPSAPDGKEALAKNSTKNNTVLIAAVSLALGSENSETSPEFLTCLKKTRKCVECRKHPKKLVRATAELASVISNDKQLNVKKAVLVGSLIVLIGLGVTASAFFTFGLSIPAAIGIGVAISGLIGGATIAGAADVPTDENTSAPKTEAPNRNEASSSVLPHSDDAKLIAEKAESSSSNVAPKNGNLVSRFFYSEPSKAKSMAPELKEELQGNVERAVREFSTLREFSTFCPS